VTEARRGTGARIGLLALNLPATGLGLLRLGDWREALALWLVTPVSLLLVLVFWVASPILSFRALLATLAVPCLAGFAAFVAALVLTWRRSRFPTPRPLRSRWYSLVVAYVATQFAVVPLVSALHGLYKPFYLPAEGMTPTLLKGDRIVASMRSVGTLRRGDVIVFKVGPSIYIKRVAALPGDRIAMRNGVVILNGQQIEQRLVGTEKVEGAFGQEMARRTLERFPDERAAHSLYDMGRTIQDDMAEQRVAPGHVFVLGDNRDHSADSRVLRDQSGVEQLPISDITGRALYHSWGPSGKSGQGL
jgi:signal peptidase I